MYELVEIKRSHNILCAFMKQDPIHPLHGAANLSHRFSASHRNYAYVNENNDPVMICCIKLSHKPIGKMDDIFNTVDDYNDKDAKIRNVLTFYSIFRTKVESVDIGKDLGLSLMMDVTKLIHSEFDEIKVIRTLSPIPTLSEHCANLVGEEAVSNYIKSKRDPVAKFHLRNKAKMSGVIFNADCSKLRQEQSYGWMVAYDYSDCSLFKKDEEVAEELKEVIPSKVEGK